MDIHGHAGFRLSVFGLVMLVAGCAQPPVEAFEATQKAIEIARAAGAPEYAKEEFARLEESFNRAKEELADQERVFPVFRSYRKADRLLSQVRRDALHVIDKAGAKKEEARDRARKQVQALHAFLESAQDRLAAAAAVGMADQLGEVKADLDGVTASVHAIEGLISQGRYLDAERRAQAITATVEAVTGNVLLAVERAKRQAPPLRRYARGSRGGRS